MTRGSCSSLAAEASATASCPGEAWPLRSASDGCTAGQQPVCHGPGRVASWTCREAGRGRCQQCTCGSHMTGAPTAMRWASACKQKHGTPNQIQYYPRAHGSSGQGGMLVTVFNMGNRGRTSLIKLVPTCLHRASHRASSRSRLSNSIGRRYVRCTARGSSAAAGFTR